jgi:hypothetical protein
VVNIHLTRALASFRWFSQAAISEISFFALADPLVETLTA